MADEKIELTQKEMDSKVAAAVEKALEKVNGKNSDLLTELKAARKKSEAFGDLDPAEVRKAVENAKKGEQKALEDKGEYEKALKLATDQHTKEIAKLTEQLEEAQGGERKLRVQTALDKAMDEAGVAPAFRKAVKAMHVGDVSIIEQDGKQVAVIGDKPISDHLKTWASTDEGKNFIGDSGASGGAAGGGGSSDKGVINPWASETRNLTKQGQMERDNPTLAKQLKQAAGASG